MHPEISRRAFQHNPAPGDHVAAVHAFEPATRIAIQGAGGIMLPVVHRAEPQPAERIHVTVVQAVVGVVRLRVRDHAHLRELLLSKIFQINGVQRTETFLSLADMEPGNFAAGMLDQMSSQRGESKTT